MKKCFITNKICEYDKQVDIETPSAEVFMISQYGFPYDHLFEQAIKPAMNELNKKIDRADQALELGYVMCQRICRKIKRSNFVIADISEANGNVFYELGLSYGLGKDIVLLANKRASHPYLQAFKNIPADFLEYESYHDLEASEEFEKRFQKPLSLQQELLKSNFQEALLNKTPIILNITNAESMVKDYQERAIHTAVTSYNTEKLPRKRSKLENWNIQTYEVGNDLNILDAITKISKAKICIIDTTQYGQQPNAFIYFLLGVAHACERDVVPIINRSLNNNTPFDIKGLWQISFTKIKDLESELKQILPNIDKEFKKQREEFLFHQVWDPFMDNGRDTIHVFTCAREAKHDEDRGNRTNVDKWDFETVSDLSFFIAHKYPTKEVKIESPKNKETTEIQRHKFLSNLEEDLRDKDCIIIGSPDVSDYTEMVLAKIHGLKPYNKQNKDLPYIFIKKTMGMDHPRKQSAFYGEPDAATGKESIRFRCGDEIVQECYENTTFQDGQSINMGEACAVITLANNPYKKENNKYSKIMVISGFTGVATYASVKFLTSPDEKVRAELEKYFTERKELESAGGGQNQIVHILLTVKYRRPTKEVSHGDTRMYKSVSFKTVRIIGDRLSHAE
jgi:hypothetical protein